MKTAAIYCRVSSDAQEKEGTSLQTQMEYCLDYCQKKGYEVTYRFSEAFTGLSLERPQMDQLRELVRSEVINIIVCYSLERLTRDPATASSLHRRSRSIKSSWRLSPRMLTPRNWASSSTI